MSTHMRTGTGTHTHTHTHTHIHTYTHTHTLSLSLDLSRPLSTSLSLSLFTACLPVVQTPQRLKSRHGPKHKRGSNPNTAATAGARPLGPAPPLPRRPTDLKLVHVDISGFDLSSPAGSRQPSARGPASRGSTSLRLQRSRAAVAKFGNDEQSGDAGRLAVPIRTSSIRRSSRKRRRKALPLDSHGAATAGDHPTPGSTPNPTPMVRTYTRVALSPSLSLYVLA